MESHALPGSIQVTERAYERLRARFDLECRGTIDVKGKGPLLAYFLTGRREGAAGRERAG
jgi:class 3 adenylate cyclase